MIDGLQDQEFKNKAREDDDGNSIIRLIKKNSEWKYEYIPPGTHRNASPIWKPPACKKMVNHLRICGGSVTFMMNIICDGIPCNMQQLLVAILDEFEKEENLEHYKQWQRLVELGEKATLRFGDDAMLRGYRDGTAKGVAQLIASKRKGNDAGPATTKPVDPTAAMLADLMGDGEEDGSD